LSNVYHASTVTDIANPSNGHVKVGAGRHQITIVGAEGKAYSIVTAGGALVKQGKCAAETTISVAPGVYIVNVEGRVTKVNIGR